MNEDEVRSVTRDPDGGVTLVRGEISQRWDPPVSNAEMEQAATAFFADDGQIAG